MCYLVARKLNSVGCLALHTSLGKDLVEFKRTITDAVGYGETELVTISRPSAYCEYEPYRFRDTKEEFLNLVLAMQ